MAEQPSSQIPKRYTASQLPVDADPAEKDFLGLLHNALAPSYVLIRRLGAGGMGTVYVARDPVLKRLVAVKVMSPELSKDPGARARFQREAQAVAAISHPNVVSVYAVGQLENGLPYLVMQYVEGRSMADRIADDGPLDVPAAKKVLGEVAAALAATHKKGIIHRDIKPANILWDDESGRALVTDFGIAAVLERPDERGKEKLTAVGTSVGTPAYMSPEQLLAEPITEKSDIYALGLLCYELLIGEGPYAISSPREMMAAHLRDEPRKLSTLRPEVDAELEQLISACLSKDPAKRPSAQLVASHLTHGASMLLEWPPPGLEDFARRYSSALIALTVGGFLIGVPLLGLSTLTLGSDLRRAMPSPGALVALTGLGFVALIIGGAGLLGLFRHARSAVARGFGWLTVVEAACDERGDAGALIAGGREYAALSASERNAMRTRRLTAGVMRLVGALTPVVGYVVGLVFAARLGGGDSVLVLSSLWLGLALLVLARAVVWAEEWRLRRDRARLAESRTKRAEESRLGESWTAAFDAVRAGQRLGAGVPRGFWQPRFVAPAIAGALTLGVAALLFLGYAMTAIGAMSELTFNSFGSGVSTTALDRLRKIARLERLRLPADASITPLRAGELLRSFAAHVQFQRPTAVEARYLRDARRLPAATLDTLRRVASHRQLAEFRAFARARSYDYYGALMPLARLDSMSLPAVPILKFAGVRNVALSNWVAGIVAMAEGRTADAELRFREVLSAGFLLIREGTFLIDALVGRTLVLRARTGLAALYAQTGRNADAAFVSEAADPADAAFPERQLQLDQAQGRISALRVLGDTATIRGMRIEVLNFPLAYGPCGDLKQVVFGVDSVYTNALTEARKTLVRFPSDSVLWLKFSLALERPMRDGFGDGGWIYEKLALIARAVDVLTGSKRLQSCVSMLS